jgi:hypothetical protein
VLTVLLAVGLAPALEGSPAAGRTCSDAASARREASAMAQSCGRRVEVLDARNETDLLFAQPDGTLRLERQNHPVRIHKAGGWADLDPSLRFAADGSVVPVATTVGLVFSGGGDAPLVRMTADGRSINVGAPFGTLGRPVLDGSSATYPEVLPDVDLKVTAHSEGYTEVLIVKTREAAANPLLRTVSYPVSGEGLTTSVDEVGNLSVVDQWGEAVMVGAPPTMWDSAPRPSGPAAAHQHASADVTHEHAAPRSHGRVMPVHVLSAAGVHRAAGERGRPGEAARLSVTPSQAFLQDPKTVYPVMIDPPVTQVKMAWTYVSADCGGCNFLDSSAPAQTGMKDGHNHYSYFKMSMAGLSYLHPWILSATFEIDLLTGESNYWKETDVYDVGSISGATTWNNRPAKKSGILASVTLTSAPTPGVAFTITEQVKYASSKAWTDETLGMFPRSDTDWAYGRVWSNNPKMVVTYNMPPEVPTAQAFSGICSDACVSPAIIRSATPTLRATVTDTNGDDLRGQFEVRSAASDTATVLASGESSKVGNGGAAEWTVPAGALTNGTVYWRVYTKDAYNAVSGWTAWQTLTVDTTVPTAPTVMSTQYPSQQWGAVVGTAGQFQFRHTPASGTSDVKSFTWWVDGQGGTGSAAASLSGNAATATVSFTPATDMAKVMHVQAVDAAGNAGPVLNYTFKVSPLPNRCFRWLLDQTSGTVAPDTGNTDAADEICGPLSGATVVPQNGTLSSGVTWVTDPEGGARDRFVRFNGSGRVTMASSVLDTSKSFTVMAWVRASSLTQRETVISQDGVNTSSFSLRYEQAANGGTGGWCFGMSSADSQGSRISACATGQLGDSVPPATGQWVHLAGVYDSVTHTIAVHVMGNQESCNGERVAVPFTSTWSGSGPLALGRALVSAAHGDFFSGDIDHVYAHQRALETSEICRQVI